MYPLPLILGSREFLCICSILNDSDLNLKRYRREGEKEKKRFLEEKWKVIYVVYIFSLL